MPIVHPRRRTRDRAPCLSAAGAAVLAFAAVVDARDGYQVVFSWAELVIAPIGDQAIVAHATDGAPLGRDEGPTALVSAADTRGARQVSAIDRAADRRKALAS